MREKIEMCLIRGVSAFGTVLLLTACATNPAVKLKMQDQAAMKKVNLYSDKSQRRIALIATHKRTVASSSAAEDTMSTDTKNRYFQHDNLVFRFSVIGDEKEPVRYINIVDIESMHLDLTGKSSSYVETRVAPQRIPVSPKVSVNYCDDRKDCYKAAGAPLGLVRLRDRKLENGIVVKESSYRDYDPLQAAVYGGQILASDTEPVVDIKVFRGRDAVAMYDETKKAVDDKVCKRRAEELAKRKEYKESTIKRLEAVAKQRPLTGMEQSELRDAQYPESRFDAIPYECLNH